MGAVVSLLKEISYPAGSFVSCSRLRTFFTTATAFEVVVFWIETRTTGLAVHPRVVRRDGEVPHGGDVAHPDAPDRIHERVGDFLRVRRDVLRGEGEGVVVAVDRPDGLIDGRAAMAATTCWGVRSKDCRRSGSGGPGTGATARRPPGCWRRRRPAPAAA